MILRHEFQSAVEAETFPGELIEGFVYLRRVVLDGDPESGGEELVLKTLVWTRGVLGRYQSVS